MPTILEELLPKTWVTGISSAIAIVAIADSVRTILSGGPGSILGKDNGNWLAR